MIRRTAFVILALLYSAAASAQTPAARATLMVTVTDQNGGLIPGATVTLMSQKDGEGAAPLSAQTSAVGLGKLDALAPGMYALQVSFTGFETVVVRDLQLRAGENARAVTLPIKEVAESMTVDRDKQTAALDPVGSAFSTVLTRAQIAALPDDPDEMEAMLKAMSPPGSSIRVDGFTGGKLPPKSQIRSIRLPRMDMLAAQNHGGLMGAHFIDILTQPGLGPIRGGFDTAFRDDALNARNSFAPVKGDERLQRYGASLSGTIVPNRSSFSIVAQGNTQYDTTNLLAAVPGGTVAAPVRQPSEGMNLNVRVDQATTADHALRASFQRTTATRRNRGVGNFDLQDRAYTTTAADNVLRVSENGPLGRRFFGESRLQLRWTDSDTASAVEAPTVRVLDAFTSGGAQQDGGRHAVEFEAATDVDYVRGRHSARVGFLLEGGRYRSDDSSNYLGTFTFSDLAAYQAGTPLSFTRRTGDPLVTYSNLQAGVYAQDDFRLSRSTLLSVGLRYEAQTLVSDQNNVSPRASITWSPFKSGKTTFRGGWGLFTDWIGTGTYEQTLRVDGVRQREINILSPSFPDPGGAAGSSAPTNKYVLNSALALPASLSANAGIDQSITSSLRVTATYTYRRGSGWLRGRNLNAPVSGLRPDANFSNVVEVESDAASRTHTLNVGATLLMLEKRRTFFAANYTVGSTRSNTTGAFSIPANGDDLSTEWGTTAPRHRFSAMVNTQPFANLEVSASMTGQSGAPYTVTTGTDANGDGVFNDRPTGTPRSSAAGAATWDIGLRVSYAVGFGARPPQTGGAGGTVIMMGPGGGGGMPGGLGGGAQDKRYRVEFFVSGQNVSNHQNYVGYSGVLTSPFFGQPTNVMNPRKLELGMRFGF